MVTLHHTTLQETLYIVTSDTQRRKTTHLKNTLARQTGFEARTLDPDTKQHIALTLPYIHYNDSDLVHHQNDIWRGPSSLRCGKHHIGFPKLKPP